MRNYQERLSALLHIEEVQMELEMREFDLKQVSDMDNIHNSNPYTTGLSILMSKIVWR